MVSVRRASASRGRADSAQVRRQPTTHYAVLRVPPASTLEKLKDTYYRLARELHPDLHPGDAENEERFKAITLAWSILRDPKLRADYDTKLALEGRFSCPKCQGRGLRSGFLKGKFEREILCDECEGLGEKQ